MLYTLAAMRIPASHTAKFQLASDQSLLVYFAQDQVTTADARPSQTAISLREHDQVRRFLRVMELEPIPGVRNLHPAYSSVLIKFDSLKLRHEVLEEILRGCIGQMEKVALPEPRLVEIPVCYDGEHGPDLNEVAKLRGLTPEKVVQLHSSATYVVYFLGFVPGFAYLGELPPELATPRLPTPRRSVPAGSVGIAGNQTGVYPIATPGGWRLLGRTPLAMFRPDRAEMSLLSIGDCVHFVPISPNQFATWEKP